MVSNAMPAPSRIAIIFFLPKRWCPDSDSKSMVVETWRKDPTAMATTIAKTLLSASGSELDNKTAAGATSEKSNTKMIVVIFLKPEKRRTEASANPSGIL